MLAYMLKDCSVSVAKNQSFKVCIHIECIKEDIYLLSLILHIVFVTY